MSQMGRTIWRPPGTCFKCGEPRSTHPVYCNKCKRAIESEDAYDTAIMRANRRHLQLLAATGRDYGDLKWRWSNERNFCRPE
jgi:hypothetical protein